MYPVLSVQAVISTNKHYSTMMVVMLNIKVVDH
jgi:hypothetical protein